MIKPIVRLKAMAKYSAFIIPLLAPACQTFQSESEKLEAANLNKAVYCMELLELHHDLETAGRECFGDTYVQHTPWLPDGKKAVLDLFARRFAANPNKTISIKRTGADGDLVWIHLHSYGTEQNPLGNAVINIFRMENGRFVEHWNVVQRVPETAKNDNSMF